MNRKQILAKVSPQFNEIDYRSPLQVGNGELAIGVDPTGFQTLKDDFLTHHAPLCTMSQWAWHSEPVSEEHKEYKMTDLTQTEYDFNGRKVYYPTQKKPGPLEVFDWLRKNPHRADLVNIALEYNDKLPKAEEVTHIDQRLELIDGEIKSKYQIGDDSFNIVNVCDSESDTLGFKVESKAFGNQKAKLYLEFPYASWQKNGEGEPLVYSVYETNLKETENGYVVRCVLDDTIYYVAIVGEGIKLKRRGKHSFVLSFTNEKASFTMAFASEEFQLAQRNFQQIREAANTYWQDFWMSCGFVDFTGSTHPKADELQRRIILSQYLLAIQSAGSLPPQETGLLCNSWYGKFHLEMHLWHAAYMPLWNRPQDLLKSMPWYLSIESEARKNASKNQYKGIRWPKMVGPDGIDTPSPIAPLLIWQQPHLLYMLELIYQANLDETLLKKFWPIYKETGNFMADFLVENLETGSYEMVAPIFPSQERFDPETVKNPCFELEYWRFGFMLIKKWAERVGEPTEKWQNYYDKIADSRIYDGVYISHENAPETFTEKAIDHPSQTGIYGLIGNDRVDIEAFEATLQAVLDNWDFDTLWGWDYGMMSMAATRLGKPELALEILLSDTSKNNYQRNGHNLQSFRNDLPAYLPGNGSLLLAVGLMVAGYPGSEYQPGIPKNGQWQVAYENIYPFPY